MDQLFEKKLITTKDAKELSGYTSDYLARLARSGKISGKRIGNSWFIDKESLAGFLSKQGDRKIEYARTLARTREAEYAAHNSVLGHTARVLTKPLPVPRFSEIVQRMARSQVLSFSVAALVVVSGALVSHAAVLPQFATRVAEISAEVALGFGATFGDIPSQIKSRIDTAKISAGTHVSNVASQVAFVSESISSPALATLHFSLPQLLVENTDVVRTKTFASVSSSNALVAPIAVASTVESSLFVAYEYLATPSNIVRSFAQGYRSVGENVYHTIVTSFEEYYTLLTQSGAHALAFSALSRDTLVSIPQFGARMNLAIGVAVVDASYALVRAETSAVYGFAALAPKSAEVIVAFLSDTGDVLISATARAPSLTTKAFFHIAAIPALRAPELARAVFGVDYAVASYFVASTNAISSQYLSLVEHTGRFAYVGTTEVLAFADSASSFVMKAPIALENAYLGMIGRSALALEKFSNVPKVASALTSVRIVSAPIFAAVAPAFSTGEQIAFSTYKIIRNFFTSTNRVFANLFAPSPVVILPSLIDKNTKLSQQKLAVATTSVIASEVKNVDSYPAPPQAQYTMVVQGVSQAFVDQSLSSLQKNILATVSGMIQPISNQSVVNNTTVQQVNMIQDLSNLIVRNGDFRGGSLLGATSVSGTNGNFTNLVGGATSLASTTITGNLTVSGTINISSLSLDSSMTAPYFIANSTTATSTFAGSLNVDSGGFVYATSTRNVGIGILSPAALLAIQNSTSTQPIFVAKNSAGIEVYRITNAGFVGIGTSSPTYALAVEGSSTLGNQAIAGYFTATSSTATSTFAGSFAVGTSSPIANAVFVVGTTTPLLYISSSSGRIGIGTSTPASILDIYATDAIHLPVGTSAERPSMALTGQVRYNTTTHQFEGYGDNFVWQGLGGVINAAQTTYVTAGTDDYLRFVSSSVERMTISNVGLIGIGTTSPFAALQIATSTGKNLVLSDSGAGANLKHWLFSSLGGSLFIGPTTDTYATSSPSALSVSNAGYLGIGTTSPSSALSVQGNGYFSGTAFFGGAVTANGNAILGASSANTLAINSLISSNIIPNSNIARSLGSVSYYWKDLYVDNIVANNISTASTTIAGTQSNTFNINSDNATADTEDMTLIFFRGTTVPNATLSWNSADSAKRFEFNQPLFIQNGSASTTLTTFDLKSVVGQTADIFRIASSSGATFFSFTGAGRLGIGTSTPASILDIYATDAIRIPVGTSSERPTLAGVGQVRYNTTTHQFEGYGDNSVWQGLGGVVDADQSTYITADTNNSNEDFLRFFTNSVERMSITRAGTIGIGTTTPFASLQIATSTGKNLVLSDSGAGANLKHWLFSSLGGSLFIGSTTDSYSTSSPSAITIANNGNFGLGTTSPATLLSVAGSGYITGGLGIGLVNTTAGTLQTSGNASFGGSVGIGVTSPSQALDVAGFINTDQYSGFKQAGNTVLYASTTNFSTAVGASGAAAWMSATTSLTYNTAVGYQALNTTPAVGSASYNTALGALALKSNTAGTYNNAIGMQSLTANTTGNYNVANGGQALRSNTTGSGNTTTGYQVLYYNNSATSTTAYGMNAGMGTGAYSNQGSTYLGYQAGYSAGNSSDYNTFLGYQAGYGVTTGARNVIIGNSTISASQNQIISGSNNIAIGNDVVVANATASGQLNIGNFIYGTGFNGTGTTLSTGSIGIGTSSPFAAFQIATTTGKNLVLSDSGAGANLKHWLFSSLGGSLYIGTANDSYATSSPALAVTNAGLIGAGTSSPSVALDLANSKTGINIWASTGVSFKKANIGYSGSDVFTISTNANTGGTYQDIQIVPNNASGYTGLYLNTLGQAGLGYASFPDTSIGTALMVNGRLGIGTSSPTGNFSVTANGRATGDLRYGIQIVNSDNANTQATGIAFFGQGGAGGNKWITGTDLNHDNSNNFFIATSSGPGVVAPFFIGSDSTIQFANLSAAPSVITRRLYEVNGALWFDNTQLSGGTASGYWSHSSGITYGTTLTDKFGVGTTSPYAKFAIHANDGESNTTLFSIASSTASATTTLFTVLNTGYVGIGTTSPSSFFSVGGNGYFTGGLGLGLLNTAAGSLLTSGSVNVGSVSSDRTIITGNSIVSQSSGVATSSLGFGTDAANWKISSSGSFGSSLMISNGYFPSGGLLTILHGGGGQVGIGMTTPGFKLDVQRDGNDAIPVAQILNMANGATASGLRIRAGSNSTAGSVLLEFLRPDGGPLGTVSQGGATSVAYNTTSDRRRKENIVNTSYGLSTLLQIPVRDFDFISDPSHIIQQGFIAQELHSVYPIAVSTNGDNGTDTLGASSTPWGVDYGRLTPLIVKSIQELNTSVNSILNGTATSTITNVAYQNASTTATDTLCLGGDCRTVWPAASAPPDLSGYAFLTDIPSLASYATTASLASATSSLTTRILALENAGYLTNSAITSFVSTSTLASTLTNYATSATLDSATSSLAARLTSLEGAGYLTSSALSPFVSTSTLASTLASYSTTASMNSAIASAIAGSSTSSPFVTSTALSSTLSNYALASSIPSPLSLGNLYGTVTGNITPDTHNTYDLGTNSIRFANIYAQNIHAGDLTFTETTSAVSGNTLAVGDVVTLYVNSTSGSTHTIPIDFRTAINTTSYGANNVYFNTSGALAIGISSTTAPRGKLDVEGSIASGDARFLTLANTSGANGNAAIPYSLYIPSTTGDLNFASNDNNGTLINSSYSAWNLKIGGQSDAFSISRSPTGSLAYSDVFHISSSGNSGFGTSSPATRLSVQGNQYTSGTAFFGGAITATSSLTLSGLSAGSLYIGSGSIVSAVSTSTLSLGTGLSYSGTLGSFVGGSSGSLTVATSSLYSGTTGQFPYFSGTNTLTATSSIFLAANGNVGVGLTNPIYQLEVASTTGKGGIVAQSLNNNDSTGNVPKLMIGQSAGINADNLQIGIYGMRNNQNGNAAMAFYTGGDTISEKMRIDTAGNVGIGTISPLTTGGTPAKLDVKLGTNQHFVVAQATSLGTTNTVSIKTLTDAAAIVPLEIVASGIAIQAPVFSFGAATAVLTTHAVESFSDDVVKPTGGSWGGTSDQRLKTNIVPITDALSKITQLNPILYDWINPSAHGNPSSPGGFSAQEIMQVFPQWVKESECFGIDCSLIGGAGSKSYSLSLPFTFDAYVVGAIKELNTRTKFISSAATSTVLTVDVAGNVGIGTTTPNHALSVAGDIGATGFVNTSTREAKTNISYVTAGASEEMLNQLVDLRVATYRYKIENQNDPLRLGFIAEEAQQIAPEVLSSDGKGVDLYKLATFTLSGVQALAAKVDSQNTRITSLETRVTALESGSISTSSGTPTFSTTTLASALNSFGVLIEKGIAQFNTLVFRSLVASKDADGTSSAGSVVMLAGNTVAQVNNSLVVPSTKVFVTFNSQITGSWWVSDKVAGSFRVVLSAPQSGDVSFDYFLVQTEGQLATSSPMVAPGVSQSNGADTTPPVITLLGDNPVHLSVGGVFADPSVAIVDAVDGTTPVVTFINGIQQEINATTINTSSEKIYIITYSATDRAGNTATVTRSVIVGASSAPAPSTPQVSVDTTLPVVTLTGSATMEIATGGIFTDPGATATDDTDGTLAAIVTGSVDIATAGLYTLTYTATDVAGNTASVSRVVTVSAPVSTPAI